MLERFKREQKDLQTAARATPRQLELLGGGFPDVCVPSGTVVMEFGDNFLQCGWPAIVINIWTSINDELTSCYEQLKARVAQTTSLTLNEFDRFAGELMVRARTANKGAYLSDPAVIREICLAIDQKQVSLRNNLPPKAKQALAKHNAIKTWAKAAEIPDLIRHVRRRLNTAEEKYRKGLSDTRNLSIE